MNQHADGARDELQLIVECMDSLEQNKAAQVFRKFPQSARTEVSEGNKKSMSRGK
tara:strand:- start:26 stop:190 length:165 start_codon:yes stop_codon:yes gene_type:complete